MTDVGDFIMDSDLSNDVSNQVESPADALRRHLKRVQQLRDAWEIQDSDGNWNSSSYMCGMRNGLEFAMAIMEDREPVYKQKPASGYLDETHSYPPAFTYEQAPSVHKHLTPEQSQFVSELESRGSGTAVVRESVDNDGQ
jgi:hypothetical protein